MNYSMRRIVAAAAVLGVMTVSTGCYGPFNLTKNVYHWNSNVKGSGEVNSKWMREFVFFGMFIIPVYEFSLLLDTFIFNSIHFWTGDSPIKSSDLQNDGTRVATLGETTIRWTSLKDGATVTYERDGVAERQATIEPNATGYRLIDENGSLLSEGEYGTDGSVRLLDGECRVVNRWSKEQLQSIAQRQ
ncbi:MAG: hypothetical protein OJF50_003493 [Nitrospira sp.]|jgi:hypothetical protein|nr:hypothetical protein [Nitrospira sp.]